MIDRRFIYSVVLAFVGATWLLAQGVFGPRLFIDSEAGQRVRLSWTNNPSGLILQRANSLTAPLIWNAAPGTPMPQNDRFTISFDTSGTEAYFRLALTGTGQDSDQDGLPDSVELLLGLDPHNPDSDGNGIKDGDEDSDGDGLTNRQEILFGTNPALADSDGDGWNDEAEITAGTDPLDPKSMPLSGFVAQPPVRVTAPATGGADGLSLNTFIALPPVRVVVPAVGGAGGLPMNTFLAQPPVQVQIQPGPAAAASRSQASR